MAIQNLRSSQAHRRAIPTLLSAGQICINTNEASPGVFFKDSNGDLVKVGPVHVGTSAPNSSPDSLGAGSLVTGTVYQILTVGSSDFTAVGASANTVGTIFTATGTTTGTGTVSTGVQGNEKGEMWLDTTGGAYDLKIYDGSAWRSQAGEFVNVTGDNMTGNLTLGTDKVVLNASSGAGTFAGTVQATDGTQYVKAYETGFVQANRTNGANFVFEGRLSNSTTSSIKGNGSAYFASNVGIGTNSPTDHGSYGGTLEISGSPGGALYLKSSSDVGQLGMNSSGLQLRTRSAKDILFTTNNSERARIDSSGRLLLGTTTAGNSLADDLTIASSGHTGMTIRAGTTASNSSIYFADGTSGDQNYRGQIEYNHNLEIMRFYVAAGERLRVDGSGRVGIGNTTMSSFTGNSSDNLVVGGGSGSEGITVYSAAQGSLTFADGTSGNAAYRGAVEYNHTADQLAFRTAGTGNRMVIDSSGRVLIGTTTEGAADADNLTIADSGDCGITIRTGTTSTGAIYFSDATSGTGEADGFIDYNQSSRYLRFGTAQGERLRIDSSGNVGIGTTSAATKLHVNGTTPTMRVSHGTSQVVELKADSSASILRTTTNHPLLFGTNDAERMRIDSSGRLLVGTTAADQDAPLTVCRTGAGGATPSTISGSTVATFRATGGLSHESRVSILGGSSGASQLNFGDRDDEDVANIRYDHSNNSMRFVTLNAERMRIDAYGRVGIGVTPEAWHSNTNVLRIGAGGALHSQTTNRITELTTNIYSDGSNNRYIHTDFAAQYYQYLGAHVWSRAASGTAGNVATMQESMRIDTSGRVGIGVTNPADQLQVNGSGTTAGDGAIVARFYDSAQSKGLFLGYDSNEVGGTIYGANLLTFQTYNGTSWGERMRIDTSGRLLAGTTTPGDAAADNLTLSSSGDTGITIRASETDSSSIYFADGTGGTNVYTGAIIYDHATDHMSLHTNGGAERLRIGSNGNVSVGTTTTDQAKLHVENGSFSTIFKVSSAGAQTAYGIYQNSATGFGTTDGYFVGVGTDGTGYVWNYENLGLGFGTNNTERMRIDSAGRLLLGTTTANGYTDRLLTVGDASTSNVTAEIRSSSQGQISFSDGVAQDAGSYRGLVGYNHGTDYMYLYTNGTERMRIDGSGNVGLGRTSASSRLDLQAASGRTQITLRNVGNTSDASTFVAAEEMTSGNADLIMAARHNVRFFSNLNEKMRIDTSGQVGIGTSAPSNQLHLHTATTSNVLQLTNSATGTAAGHGMQIVTSSLEMQLRNREAGPTTFYTSNLERMRIDSSGKVLVNTTAAGSDNSSSNVPLQVVAGSGAYGITVRMRNTYDDYGFLTFASNNGNEQLANVYGYRSGANAGNILFSTNNGGSPTERMRIKSNGNILIGKNTSGDTSAFGIEFYSGSTGGLHITNATSDAGSRVLAINRQSGNGEAIEFRRANTEVGSITVTTSATAYNTSSDYRLKENVNDITDGITRVKQLQPKRFNFIADADTTVDGFLAHEAQTVVPEAVTGTHNEVDDDGNPVMQGIDQSKLVPLLTAALQEAIAKIETLEAKVAALEAA